MTLEQSLLQLLAQMNAQVMLLQQQIAQLTAENKKLASGDTA